MLKPIPSYADIYTVKEFLQNVREGFFTDGDGTGHPIIDDQMDDSVDIFPSTIKFQLMFNKYDKIAWFNI